MENSNLPVAPKIQWRNKYAAAFMDEGKMIVRYRFPYAKRREASLLGTYGLSPADRLNYYQNLSAMVERNLVFSNYLKEQEIPSILTFENTFQKQEENGIIGIYGAISEPVTPITKSLLAENCNAAQLLDAILRLTIILRDINKLPTTPALRYLDLDDVYLTADNKIKLGGFYYVTAQGLTSPPPYLPDAAPVVPAALQAGASGNLGTDMQILCKVTWNLFSGLPWNCEHTELSAKIPPRYAPPQLRTVLELGLKGNTEDFNLFRRQLTTCRKELGKTAFAEMDIPIPTPYQKEYQYTASATPAPMPGNSAKE